MLVMYLCVRGIAVGYVFVYYGYCSWSCICVLGVSMLIFYACDRIIDFGHASVC
jgi:hypothetical protein